MPQSNFNEDFNWFQAEAYTVSNLSFIKNKSISLAWELIM